MRGTAWKLLEGKKTIDRWGGGGDGSGGNKAAPGRGSR